MSRLTVYLARLIGLFTLAVIAGFLLRGPSGIDATVADAPLMLCYAMIAIALGLAIVLAHNVWSGGALPVVVTLVGWAILVKGATLLFLAPGALPSLLAQMHYGQHLLLYFLPALLLGAYLTYAGFRTKLAA